MTKTPEVMTEVIRNPKHTFRKAEDRPNKPQRHRYERRKVREFMRLSSWTSEEIL